MRLRFSIPLVVVTTAVGLGLFAPASVPASCVGRTIEVPGAPTAAPSTMPTTERVVQTVRLTAGAGVAVDGEWFFVGCNDTSTSSGCSTSPEHTPEAPAQAVPLILTQGERSWKLGTADASGPSGRYAVHWNVQLPPDLAPGTATLTADGALLLVEVGGARQ